VKNRESAGTVASAIGEKPITIAARAGAEGRLFGSVTAADIAEAIEAQTGAVVDRRRIVLAEPIRSVGTHTVTVHLHADVDAEVVVEVTPLG
jgi:large subunit ribosomal protein L9